MKLKIQIEDQQEALCFFFVARRRSEGERRARTVLRNLWRKPWQKEVRCCFVPSCILHLRIFVIDCDILIDFQFQKETNGVLRQCVSVDIIIVQEHKSWTSCKLRCFLMSHRRALCFFGGVCVCVCVRERERERERESFDVLAERCACWGWRRKIAAARGVGDLFRSVLLEECQST